MLKLSEEPIMQAHIHASLMLSATSNASNEEEAGNMTVSFVRRFKGTCVSERITEYLEMG